LYVCILNGAQLLLKPQEESSLQSGTETLLPDDTHGASLICLEVGSRCMSRVAALKLQQHSPSTPHPPPPQRKKCSIGNRSKQRVNCFTVAAQQINKHLEAFRAAH